MKAIACIVLIIGLLKFATDAPNLLKSIFASGGDLLKGMDLNPHGQLRRQAEPAIHAAGRIGSTIAGGIGGAAAGAARAHKNANSDFDSQENGSGRGRGLHRGLATLGGGLRGMVRGGAHGFQNASDSATPRNMYNQLMSGTSEGQAAAQQASQTYREGNSTNLFGRIRTRAGNAIVSFGSDHIVDPARQFGQSVTDPRTGEQAAQLFSQIKTNNTGAMTATGTDTYMENLKNARNEAKGKISNAASLGMSQTEMLSELGMSEASVRDRARELINDGFKIKGLEIDATTGNVIGDLDAKALKNFVDAIYESDKNDKLAETFSSMSNERKDIISQYNNDTIDNFQRNVSSLSEDSLSSVLKGMCESRGMTTTFDASDLTGTLNNLVREMKTMNDTSNIGSQGATLMKALDTMQSKMAAVNTDISARQALNAAQQAQNNSGDNSGGGNS